MCPGWTQEKVARPERFELPTLCFEGRCSIQLSYGRVFSCCLILLLLQLYFEFQLFDVPWSTWSRNIKSDANDLRFPKARRDVFALRELSSLIVSGWWPFPAWRPHAGDCS